MSTQSVTVVIPTKNEERYLPRLLDSLERQTLEDIEIVVADAGSTDGTREAALSRGCRVVKGGPPALGRNNGARFGSGHLLCFADADITLPSGNYLERASTEISRRRLNVAGVLVRHDRVGSNLRDVLYGALYEASNVGLVMAEHSRGPLMQSLMFAQREAFFASGGFPLYEFGEDSAFAARAVVAGFRFGVLRDVPPAKISPRRLEREGFFRALGKYAFFNGWRLLGREFEVGGKHRYF